MNRRLALAALLVAASAALPSAAAAQPVPLKGLTSLQIVAEDTDENDAKCGVTKADIVAAASKALADSGVKVVDSSRSTLGVSLITLVVEPEGLCVSHVGISLRALAFGSLSYAPDEKLTIEGTLQQQRSLFSSPKTEHGARMRERVRTLAERIAKEIAAANR